MSAKHSPTLRIVQAKAHLVPLELITDNSDLQTLQGLIFETLLHREDGEVFPGLISGWEIHDGGLTWLLTVRPNARFHDGTVCTVDDVIHAIGLVRDARDGFGTARPYARYLQDLRMEAMGPNRLRLIGPEPTGDLADVFADIHVGKYSADGHPVIGTGPYRVADYAAGQAIHLEAVDKGLPFQGIEVSQADDPIARYEAVRSGRADVATGLELLPKPPADDGLQWHRTGNTMSVCGFLNGFAEPFCRPEARLAINLALDVPAIIREVWHGLAMPAASVVSPYHFGFPPGLTSLGRDVARARALFDQVPMPGELVLRTPEYIPDRAPQVSRVIADQLGALGIRVRIEIGTDRPRYASEVGAKKIGHMALFDSTPLSSHRVLQEKISGRHQGVWWQGVKDDVADRLIEVAHGTVSTAPRAAAYAHCLTWLHDHPHWLYLYHPMELYAHRRGLESVTMTHGGQVRLNPHGI